MRPSPDYQTAAYALIRENVAVIEFSKDLLTAKNGSPYRRYRFTMGESRIAGAAFIEGGRISMKLPPIAPRPVGVVITFGVGDANEPIEGSGRITLPGEREAALTPLPN